MLNKIFVLLASLALSSSALAAQTFMPTNKLNLKDNLEAAGGITEAQFNAVIDRALEHYAPIFEQFGATLTVERLWSDSTVNASAEQPTASLWRVNMYGGLARRPEVTEDGFAMVLCHEIGHHLGGYPFVQAWAADEGQSDLYATGACAFKIFQANFSLSQKAVSALPDTLKSKCDANHAADVDRDICYRAIVAGKSLADLLGALGGTSVGYETPDASTVSRTNHAHPAAQCRFDTYAAGAYCGASKWDHALIPGKEMDDHNSVEAQTEAYDHSCESGDGARPRCWFAPVDGDGPAPAECPIADPAMCDLLCKFDPSQPWCP